jgi:hypothetical protein
MSVAGVGLPSGSKRRSKRRGSDRRQPLQKKNAISVHRAENEGKPVKAHPTLSEDFPSPYF